MDIPDDIQEAVVKQFTSRYPEYSATEKNAALMREAVDRLCEAGHPFHTDTLALAFNFIEAAKGFEQPEQEVVEVSNEEMVRQKHVENLAARAETLTDE